ncbi:hypothetical protein SLS62_005422 [Diatrype stigma]|uniref:Uncharacterized protein n=1 Tax=Diatrype stigma TaxID=117547 RepID=A0AAN9URP4_9PEZI
MQFRASLPKLSLKFSSSSKPSTSSVFSPPSNSSTPTSSKASTPHPMTPPARLYLRNVLPASPEYLPTPPPPPPQPRPWVWQCHGCLTIWRLATTRRCLLCSHEYCTATTKPATNGRRGSGSRKSKRRRNGSGGGAYCRAEFDYTGWEEWGAWRRKVRGLEARSAPRARDRAFLHRAHDCWLDCDYPSQCHHERAQLAAQAAIAASRSGSSAYYSLRTVVEEEQEHDLEPPSPPIVEHGPRKLTVTNPDDDLQLNEALDIAQEVEQEQEQPKSPTSPKSPLSQTSFFPDDEAEDVAGAAAVAVAKSKQKKLWWQPVDEYKSQSSAAEVREDQSLMPLGYSGYDSMKSRGGSGKLTVRNSSEPDETEGDTSPESSSTDDDYYSSSDDSDDYEMAESDLSSVEDPRTLEEIERDLRLLLEASKTLTRD